MPLPANAVDRLLKEHEVLGLVMAWNSERPIAYFDIKTVEGPNNLAAYSMGGASAMAAAGTDWDDIVDANSRRWLEPADERVIYHIFTGVSPAQAWVYRRYPANRDINSLLSTRTIGSGAGHFDGWISPYRSPSPLTEMFTMKGTNPSFLGYNPYAEPSSITVLLYFYVTRYDVEFLGVDPTGDDKKDRARLIAPGDVRARAKVRTLGGHDAVPLQPGWRPL